MPDYTSPLLNVGQNSGLFQFLELESKRYFFGLKSRERTVFFMDWSG